MADLESRMDKVEERVTDIEKQVNILSTKVDMFIEESREARKKQDEDMREMRTKQDSDMREIRQSVSDMGKHTRNLTIAVIIGIAAIAVLLK